MMMRKTRTQKKTRIWDACSKVVDAWCVSRERLARDTRFDTAVGCGHGSVYPCCGGQNQPTLAAGRDWQMLYMAYGDWDVTSVGTLMMMVIIKVGNCWGDYSSLSFYSVKVKASEEAVKGIGICSYIKVMLMEILKEFYFFL